MESETDSQPRQGHVSMLQSNAGDERYSFRTSDCSWHDARAIHVYSTRLALFIHGITSAKKTREVRPAILVRESSTQLLIY